MAAAIPLSFSIDPQHHLHFHRHSHCRFLPKTNLFKSRSPKSLLVLHKSRRPCFKISCLFSDDAFSSVSSPSAPEDSKPSSLLQDPFRTNRFLTNEEYEKLNFLSNFSYSEELESGSLTVRAMRPEEIDFTVKLLAESYAESLGVPVAFVPLLSHLIKQQHLTQRLAAMPHAATLVGFYRGEAEEEVEDGGEGGAELAGTVEVCFDEKGANESPPTPTPPKDKPYICNMAVKESLRRRGIGWHILKASEKLISEMTSSKEVYLHCRMIDAAPLNMYSKAGYNIVKTDGILTLLMLQKRKHLMCKNLPTLNGDSESDISRSDEEFNL